MPRVLLAIAALVGVGWLLVQIIPTKTERALGSGRAFWWAENGPLIFDALFWAALVGGAVWIGATVLHWIIENAIRSSRGDR